MSTQANMTAGSARPAGLPVWKLLAFTMAGFLAIMTETMPAGLLPQIGRGLGISEALAGQLVTVYALGSVLAAIPVVAATRSWNRRPLLLTAIGGLLAFNTVTAMSGHYGVTLAARFVAGMAAGVVWGLLAGYARRMVPPRLQGRALAVAGVGQPIALCIGVPLGTWLGTLLDWRGVFWIMSALSLLLLAWIRLAVPDFAGQPARQRLSIRRIATMPGIRPVLLALLAWILAHNILYTYIAPFLASAGLGQRVDAMLLLFGLASLAGIWATGLLVDRWLRALTLASLALFAIAACTLGFANSSPALVLGGIAAWGLSFGGAPTLLQTALADNAGDGADVAQSMLVTVFNLAVAGGGIAGGLLLESSGPRTLPWALAALALLALGIVWSSRARGFPPGRRAAPA
ncbi:MFS transporter [Achromobacter agilis]|uniref:Purine ribonucleoside efflux pump NepI n=1 Tax=Achromobacter agilis TaxID=1353888 RepID=A0A446CB81_9BURK|nr:MFS transporter [Achromobacter agilis]SSW65126.1 Purine ribonucleoside efflux pump NepI [Achromobacter agilis]